MTREEQIEKAGKECYNKYSHYYAYNDEDAITTAFEMGAKWADEHPIDVWHDNEEEPSPESLILCWTYVDYEVRYWINYKYSWKAFVQKHYIYKWMYIP